MAVALQRQADRRFGPGEIVVGSVGIDASSGAPAAEGARRIAAEWGLSLDDHRAQPARFAPLDDALLVLTMSRRQRRILTRERPELTERTFTLREAVEATDAVGPPDDLFGETASPHERVRAVVAAADAQRPPTWLRPRFDIADPAGGDHAVYAALGEEVSRATGHLADALFGTRRG